MFDQKNNGTLRSCAALAFGLWLAWISCGAFSFAQAEGDDRSLKTGDIKPELIFRKSCAPCHGERGDGDGRASVNLNPQPRDFTRSSSLTRAAMVDAVTHGRPGTAMMSWTRKYNEQQIAAVVDYIRGRFMLVALDPRIEAGRSVYRHFCQSCHGDRGQGVPAADSPRDWTAAINHAELTRERMIVAVAQGKHGNMVTAGFAARLSAENIGAAVDYVRRVLLPDLAGRDRETR